ncbi:MAG TPA: M24 family metallopeptidase [Candidatus Aminicenantes bacterium]|nr:M24 family metallopeptidase [Candidatus Aminicenantes bacterium]HRY64905.1 M24 family metallopeptidase [Candidatus Aminicenantes bacterium]HRZ71818.1 M24 family metallopeptidase [Candidatus Aminicenantes bacterium]
MMNTTPARRKSASGLWLPGLLAFALVLGAVAGFGQEMPGRPASLDTAKAPAIAARRAHLMAAVKDGIILIPSQVKSRENLNFVYLTGLKEADAVLLLDPAGNPRETIFRRAGGGPGARIMAGEPAGTARPGGPGGQVTAPNAAGPDQGLVEKPATQLSMELIRLAMSGRLKRVYLPLADLDFLARAFGETGLPNPLSQAEDLVNIDPAISELRLTKDADEIAVLRQAIDLTAEALNETFRAAEPKMSEVDLAAILRYAFDRRETEDSFLQAASGPNSTNIHFGATSRPLTAGDLVVFDVGVWLRGYTSDISRTIPAGGRFTAAQQDIYALVLEAEKAGCAGLVPGVTFKAVQTAVEDILMAGLEKLGLVTDVKSPWQRRFYIQHGFGHGIGLDVHDVWSWHSPRLDQVVMAPGMIMTMEPGLYFPEGRLETLKGKAPEAEIAAFRDKVGPVYKKYAGLGVRIEDDVLITATGNEILSDRVPKEIAAIEKLMREKSAFNLMK